VSLRRNLLIAASLGHAITMVFWALAGTSSLGSGLFAIANMGLQMAIIAYQTLLTQVTPHASRGAIVGLVGTVTGIIGGVAPTVGAYLRDGFGSTAPFWIALIAGLAMTASLQKVAVSHRSPKVS
jgi:MFS family permease